MSFGDIKLRLRALINRKDFTADTALQGQFVTDAIADIERIVRVGSMEVILTQNLGWDGIKNAVLVPDNFLEAINIFTDTGELTPVDITQFLKLPDVGGDPTHFVKIANRWLLRPTPSPGRNVYVHYYGSSEPLVLDTDDNIWTTSAVNAILYTAAALAADHYQMEDAYASRWGARAAGYVAALNDQDWSEKWGGRNTVPMPQDAGLY